MVSTKSKEQVNVRNLQRIETAKDALKILRRVAKGHARYVNKTGRYLINDRPSCLLGHAFREIGVSRDVLRRADKGDLPKGAGGLAEAIGLPHSVAIVFQTAQNAQDAGASWNKAIREAKDRAVSAGYLD